MNPFGFEFKPLTVYLGLGILSFIFCIGFLLFLNRYYVISNGFISDLYCESVVKVASSEKIAYATTVDREVNHRYYESYDGGITWQQVVTVPESLEDNLSPVIYRGFEPVCRPDNQHVCYRILPLDRAEESSPEFPTTLEQSSDGGGNWQSAHLPFEIKSAPGCRDSNPISLTFVELDDGKDNHFNLVVAVRTGGILVLSSEGKWSQRGVAIMRDFN